MVNIYKKITYHFQVRDNCQRLYKNERVSQNDKIKPIKHNKNMTYKDIVGYEAIKDNLFELEAQL